MKKIHIILSILVFTFSCSEDDNSEENSASIIGVWNHTQRVVTCSNSSDENFVFSECFQNSSLTISNDGTYDIVEFQENTGECIETDFGNGTWSMDNGKLSMISDTGSDWFIPFFEITESTLIIGRDVEDITCNDGSGAVSTYFEFRRSE